MKILVTGGAGFIGSHIVEQLLSGGHDVEVIDDCSSGLKQNIPSEVPLHIVDIVDTQRVSAVIEGMKPEAICHQAAQMSVSRSVREPLFDAKVNCLGLINVLDAAVKVGCPRVVFASSGGVLYGDVASAVTETKLANPVSPYGITKWVGERYLAFYAKEYRLKAVALRYSNVYGPRQNPHGEAGVVAIFCKKSIAGELATINGDGEYIRDYVYGPDVARANVLALTQDLSCVEPSSLTSLNVGTGIGTSVNQLEKMIRSNMSDTMKSKGKKFLSLDPVYGPARPGDLRSNCIDASLARNILGWEPCVSLQDGLQKTTEWFVEHS
jgi:UDP-glucose 4-epimerase